MSTFNEKNEHIRGSQMYSLYSNLTPLAPKLMLSHLSVRCEEMRSYGEKFTF